MNDGKKGPESLLAAVVSEDFVDEPEKRTVESVIMFKCSDGKLFDKWTDADEYEAKLTLKAQADRLAARIFSSGQYFNSDANCDCMTEEEFAEALITWRAEIVRLLGGR